MNKKLLIPFFIILVVCLAGCSARSKIRMDTIRWGSDWPVTWTIEYGSFREAMRNVDFSYAEAHPLNREEKSFYQAIQLFMHGEEEEVKRILRRIHELATDSLLRCDADLLLRTLLFYQSSWQELLEFDSLSTADSENDDLLLPRAFRSLPKEEFTFQRSSCTLPIRFTASGVPTVEVKVNGIIKKFLLDTGAGLSVVSSKVAQECRIHPITDQTSQAGTSTSLRVKIQPAAIEELKLGDISINNHPAIIIDQKDLQFTLLGIFTIMKIEGIIGWNLIKNLFIEIDYQSKSITFQKPERLGSAKANFFMLGGYPVVRLRSEEGIPLNFGIDTGARHSWITENVLKKIRPEKIQKTTKTIGSAGGKEKIESKVVPELKIIFNDYLIAFKEIGTRPTTLDEFVELDGVLGGDLFWRGKIRIDYVNRIFDFYMADIPLSR